MSNDHQSGLVGFVGGRDGDESLTGAFCYVRRHGGKSRDEANGWWWWQTQGQCCSTTRVFPERTSRVIMMFGQRKTTKRASGNRTSVSGKFLSDASEWEHSRYGCTEWMMKEWMPKWIDERSQEDRWSLMRKKESRLRCFALASARKAINAIYVFLLYCSKLLSSKATTLGWFFLFRWRGSSHFANFGWNRRTANKQV